MAKFSAPLLTCFLLLTSIAILGACGTDGIKTEAKYPTGYDRTSDANDIYNKPKSIFGTGGLLGDRKKEDGGAGALAVNSFLWRASLDTVSFMPLASADPFGGVILTDWYAPEAEGDERFKINVFILGRQLRSDGVRVRVFKQVKSGNGWKDIDTSDQTARELEDTILTRARQLRIAQLDE